LAGLIPILSSSWSKRYITEEW